MTTGSWKYARGDAVTWPLREGRRAITRRGIVLALIPAGVNAYDATRDIEGSHRAIASTRTGPYSQHDRYLVRNTVTRSLHVPHRELVEAPACGETSAA